MFCVLRVKERALAMAKTSAAAVQAADITQGVIWKQLLVYFFPILLGTFFQQLYNTADAVIVGQFVGTRALAAVGGSTGTLVTVVVNLFVGIASGTTVLVAQRVGARDAGAVSRAVHTSAAISLMGGAAFTVIGLLLARPALAAMGTPADIMDYSLTYLRVYFLGCIPSFFYNIGAGVLRAVGDTKRPLYFLVAACLTNIVLDLVFVVGFDWEVFGAAAATVISQVISAVLAWVYLARSQGPLRLEARQVRLHKNAFSNVMRVGVPAALQSNMYTISNILIQASINSFGTDTVAAWTAFGKLDGFFWMISGAFGIAVTTFAGQNFGAGRIDRVRKSVRVCMGLEGATAAVMSLLMCLCGPWLLGIFTQDTAVIDVGLVMVRWMMPFYLTFIMVEVYSAAIRGCGESLVPMVLTGTGICVFRVLWVLVLVPFVRDLRIILVSYPISWTLTSALFFVYYRSGRWLHRPVLENLARQEQSGDEA